MKQQFSDLRQQLAKHGDYRKGMQWDDACDCPSVHTGEFSGPNIRRRGIPAWPQSLPKLRRWSWEFREVKVATICWIERREWPKRGLRDICTGPLLSLRLSVDQPEEGEISGEKLEEGMTKTEEETFQGDIYMCIILVLVIFSQMCIPISKLTKLCTLHVGYFFFQWSFKNNFVKKKKCIMKMNWWARILLKLALCVSIAQWASIYIYISSGWEESK